jgi:membrane-associated phospholipid phosphatase
VSPDGVLPPRQAGHERRAVHARQSGVGAVAVAATALAAAGHVSPVERRAFELVNRLPDGAAPALWVVMQAGSFPAVFVTAGLTLAARRRRLAAALVLGGTSSWLLAKAVKRVVDRGRPMVFFHDVVLYGPAASGLGFPSGHAAVSAFIMTVTAPYLTRSARQAGWTAVGVVAFTRVFIGAHLPLDSVGGLLLGWTVGSVTNLVAGTPTGDPGTEE